MARTPQNRRHRAAGVAPWEVTPKEAQRASCHPPFAHQFQHLLRRFSAVAVGVLLFVAQLGEGTAKLRQIHHRIEPEPVVTDGLARDQPRRTAAVWLYLRP